jgi:hypothetical protein
LTDSKKTTRLIADVASASGTITVAGISGFAINDYILIGDFGDSNAEIIKLHAATAPTGTTITLATNTTKDHYTDSAVTLLNYNQVEFSRATTLTGTKTVLGSVQAINADMKESYYQDLTNSTGYAFARFYNSTITTNSDYSTGVSYSGNGNTTVQDIAEKACTDAMVQVGGEYSTEKMLLNDANDCQDAITDYDWKFELVKDLTLSVTQYTNSIDLDSLTYAMKYPGISQGVKTVKFGANDLQYVDNDEMDAYYKDTPSTTLSVQAAINATSITLTDSHEFDDVGTVYINGLDINYTANDTTTGVLSGIAVGEITAILAAGSMVWQNINTGLPTKYTITIENNLILNCPVDDIYD